MKFSITVTFSKLISFFILVFAGLLSSETHDNTYWSIGIPMAASLALGRDLATNFGKQQCKE